MPSRPQRSSTSVAAPSAVWYNGLRREDLIQDPGREVVQADRKRYDEWLAARQAALERGARPSLRVSAVTEWARAPDGDAVAALAREVQLVTMAPGAVRPRGPRFGTLVHAALATVALDATATQVAEGVSLQARILGAPAGEVEAARALVAAARWRSMRRPWRARLKRM